MIRALNAVLALALLAFGIWAASQVPDRIPIHFGLNGEADGWGSPASLIIMPAIAIATLGILALTNIFVMRNPALINMPDKKRFLELPAHEQQPILAALVQCVDVLGTGILLLFFTIEYAMYRGALGHSPVPYIRGTMVMVAVIVLPLPLWMMIRFQKKITEATTRANSGVTMR